MRLHRVWVAALVAVVLAVPAAAQFATGRVEVTAVDASGAVLPGVMVELAGPQSVTATTGPDGVARFLNLPPGTYTVKAVLQGFSDYNNKAVPVSAGGNVQLRASLAVGGVQQRVDVTAETPVIDAKKTGTSTAVTIEELQNIPTARDPWVVMQTVPGIIVDRVNVGGSESGQQSNYLAKGASGGDATWNMDGIPITDMSATGATPTYYDFDMFQEMNVSTGGADLTSTTGGVALNFVLRSGTNKLRGSARIYYESEKLQSNNMPAGLAATIGGTSGMGNRTEAYKDYGIEVGGPLVKDKAWFWGSAGRTDVTILTLTNVSDRTLLKNYSAKLQGQLSKNVRAGFTYYFGDKNKWGRGASATRPTETTYNQVGPTKFYKGEMNFVLGSNFFLTARVSKMENGFSLTPIGGNVPFYIDDDGIAHNSYWSYATNRPQVVAMAEGSWFRGAHEVKFGYTYRTATVDSLSEAPGNEIVTFHSGYPDLYVNVRSDAFTLNKAKYQSAWIGDTISLNRLTINGGLRFDWQSDGIGAYGETGNTVAPYYLPPVSTPAMPDLLKWHSMSPRVGLSYAVDEGRKSLLRFSYARFASQLGNGASGFLSPVAWYRYVYFYAVDTNGNKLADPAEITAANPGLPISSVADHLGFDINNPSATTSVNKLGDYKVPTTDEMIVGFDHELFRNFGFSASFTYRHFGNFNWRPYIGVRSPMYTKAGSYTTGGPLPDGSYFSIPYYKVTTSAVPAQTLATKGTEYVSREGYHQRFMGFEMSATKRLADKWMMRLGFSSNDHREYFDNPLTSIQDPTPSPGSPKVNGGSVLVSSSGSGKSGIYMMLPKYQFIANGLYQAPLGIDIGANFVYRQGFGQPWYRSRVTAADDALDVRKSVLLVTDVDQNRLPAVSSLDMRLGKQFKFGRVGLNLDLDIFNVINANTILGRGYDMRITGGKGFNQTLEIMNPRIVRLGARVSF